MTKQKSLLAIAGFRAVMNKAEEELVATATPAAMLFFLFDLCFLNA
jgi:hypothetical protein